MFPTNQPYLIGETAFHHEGDVDFLYTLVNHAVDLELNAIKFHMTLDLADYFTTDHDAFGAVEPWLIAPNKWEEIIGYANDKGLDAILLTNDNKAVEWALEHNSLLKAIELHAVALNDLHLLTKAAKFNGTIMLGVGGSTLHEIQLAVEFLKDNGHNDIFLMHGFQSYPTDYREINLHKMAKLSKLFELPIGYADHTNPADKNNAFISCMAAAGGFFVLEKHFTHAFGDKRIDAQAAVSLDQMKEVRDLLQTTYLAYGSGSMQMSAAEQNYGNTGPMKKAIVAAKPIASGEELTLANLTYKRTNGASYISQHQLPQLLGLKASRDINAEEIIDYNNVAYTFQKGDISSFQNTEK